MTKTTSKTANENIKETTLSNGIKVQMDISKANGHLLMKCREISGGVATVIYMIAEIATFDGKKLPAPEILNFNVLDIITLETFWAENLGK